MKDSFFRNFP